MEIKNIENEKTGFPPHGWMGLVLVFVFWYLNWTLPGTPTQWGFFPMWLGYCLAMDGLVLLRTGTSLLKRSWQRYIGLFLISAPVWWLFELLNLRTQNWIYLGTGVFTPPQYFFWTTLSFSTVIPAVFGSAELIASFGFLKPLRPGLVIGTDIRTTSAFFALGWIMLALMLAWPKVFFPFLWLSLYFILEPLNIWLGNRSLAAWTKNGDWRPVISLWLGVLLTAFFWEMWNYYSFPKWIYHVPWGNWLHIFEMPSLGYGGYLPFALELYALYHFVVGFFGDRRSDYVRVATN
jgi:hypothetical protein